MTVSAAGRVLSVDDFDAVLFDLDGVVTATAKVHSAAWKRLFDDYLATVAERQGSPFRPFTEDDYLRYVDGKPRYQGIRSFLESRDIALPFGEADDSQDAETVCGLGNRKNRYFNRHLDEEGVEVFETSLELIRALRAKGMRIAVVSSSKNCEKVLEVAGIAELFDLRFDGTHAAELRLEGKPSPDTYLAAAERLGVEAARAVVVEDAISGVQAGRAGGFGLVVGVDRTGEAEALKENGADIVVADLGELRT